MNEWISVEERLPDILEDVLVAMRIYDDCPDIYIFEVVFLVADGKWCNYIEQIEDNLIVTHWQPITPPEDEK